VTHPTQDDAPHSCSICSTAPALYYAGRKYFCKVHHAEALAAAKQETLRAGYGGDPPRRERRPRRDVSAYGITYREASR